MYSSKHLESGKELTMQEALVTKGPISDYDEPYIALNEGGSKPLCGREKPTLNLST